MNLPPQCADGMDSRGPDPGLRMSEVRHRPLRIGGIADLGEPLEGADKRSAVGLDERCGPASSGHSLAVEECGLPAVDDDRARPHALLQRRRAAATASTLTTAATASSRNAAPERVSMRSVSREALGRS